MRYTFKLLALLLFIGISSSCREKNQYNASFANATAANTHTNPDYWLLTDPEADLYNYIRTSVSIDGQKKLFMYNAKRNSLLIYDTEKATLEKKIQYDFQGPNALNAMFPGGAIKVINQDSILFYSLQQGTLSLSDYQGNIYKRTRVKNDSVGFGNVGLSSQMALRQGKVWMQSLPNTVGEFELDYKNRPNMFGSIDLSSGETREYRFDYPEIYSGKAYSQMLQMASILYNPSIDKFVISFPLSHNIYVTDFKGDIKTYPAKSKLVGNPIEIDNNRKDINLSAVTNHYYWINDSYGEFFHDPASGYYFREAQKGLSEANLAARNFETEKEIIVLDQDFNVVKRLPHHGGTLMYHFIQASSIYWNANFQHYNFKRDNEDTIYFEQNRFK